MAIIVCRGLHWDPLFLENTTSTRFLEDFPFDSRGATLPEINMEIEQKPYKDYSPSKRGVYGFPC